MRKVEDSVTAELLSFVHSLSRISKGKVKCVFRDC